MGVGKEFSDGISKSDNIVKIEKIFKAFRHEIGEWLGLELNEECEQCASMESYVGELTKYIGEYKDLKVSSIADEYKLKAFIENRHDYSAEELECLFHNGKTLLEMIKYK